MSLEQLDFIFPFVLLFYGVVVSVCANLPVFERIASQSGLEEQYQALKAKQLFGLVCLGLGGVWSLQNLWLQTPLS